MRRTLKPKKGKMKKKHAATVETEPCGIHLTKRS